MGEGSAVDVAAFLPSFLDITEAKSKQWNLPVASPLMITSPECCTTLYLPLQPGLIPVLLVQVSGRTDACAAAPGFPPA